MVTPLPPERRRGDKIAVVLICVPTPLLDQVGSTIASRHEHAPSVAAALPGVPG